jgi:signal transduction histidine kinase/DNA-binding response OmpR family regulator/streptogramin lyase
VRKILCDRKGKLWIGTKDGLSILDPKTFQFVNYQHDVTNPKSLSLNSIYDIFQDANGSIWLGIYFGGVDVVYSISTPFNVYQNDKYKSSISSNIISSIVEDKKHNLWIGSEAGGLNYFDRKNNSFTCYKSSFNDENSLSTNMVRSVFYENDQKIWIGMALGGVDLFDPVKRKFKHFRHDEFNKSTISSDNINCILKDSQGRLWIGTDNGLNRLFPGTGKFELFNTASTNISDKFISTLFEDSKQNLWIGTQYSIKVLPKGSNIVKTFSAMPNNGLVNSYVNCFHEDAKGQIWLGTYHGGISVYNSSTNKFKSFTEKDGLPSNNILGILEDDEGFLWLSTDYGLSKFNPQKIIFKNYNVDDGLPGNVFNNSSYFKDEKGVCFFGGYNGMISFLPSSIKENYFVPKVAFTALKLFNNTVEINGPDHLLKKDISLTDEITFLYNQNIFTLEFTALNFIKSTKDKYAYKLEGFDRNWNYVRTPSASYTNLPVGKYKFLARGSNNDGVWSSNPAAIIINVLPPVWKTWWAYLSYLIICAYLFYLIIRFLRYKTKLKHELYLKQREAEHQQQLYQMKLDFFTNISHEIRTPLTLILGPIDKLINMTRDNEMGYRYMLNIKNNTDRLYRLVTELLDFRKVESGNFKLYLFQEDLVRFVQEIFMSFQNLAEIKNIDYNFLSDSDEILVFFDKDQLEKVFYNLLSNAFKFSIEGGQIELSIVRNLLKNQVEINISDNGKGIPDDRLDKIFENFYQINTPGGYSIGTGIGLALSKSLVELHNGSITVKSNPSTDNHTVYTCFTVVLKLGKEHLHGDNLVFNADLLNKTEEFRSQNKIDVITPEQIEPINLDKRNTILLVEDNDEVRDFIKGSLAANYNIVDCNNGLKGWETAKNIIPDIVISDVMMPVMDGLELCRKLKNDDRTCHIPVILLTARSAYIHQVNGLQNGADIYITKPFSDQILQLNIRNLLAFKASLQKRYNQQLLLEQSGSFNASSNDEKFLQKLYKIIEKNIDNSEFSIADLTSEIGMSKSVLYKKFSALTNLSLSDFIKAQRFKYAAILLRKDDHSVSEIAFMVGFNDPKYFSKEFRKVYGVSPSEYAASSNKDKI